MRRAAGESQVRLHRVVRRGGQTDHLGREDARDQGQVDHQGQEGKVHCEAEDNLPTIAVSTSP